MSQLFSHQAPITDCLRVVNAGDLIQFGKLVVGVNQTHGPESERITKLCVVAPPARKRACATGSEGADS